MILPDKKKKSKDYDSIIIPKINHSAKDKYTITYHLTAASKLLLIS